MNITYSETLNLILEIKNLLNLLNSKEDFFWLFVAMFNSQTFLYYLLDLEDTRRNKEKFVIYF